MGGRRERPDRQGRGRCPPHLAWVLCLLPVSPPGPAALPQDPGEPPEPTAGQEGVSPPAEPGPEIPDELALQEPLPENLDLLKPENLPLVRGMLWLRTIARGTGDERDLDVYSSLSLDIGNKEVQKVTGHIDAYAAVDLDGVDGGAFSSISDTFGTVDARLYEAYVDINRVGAMDRLRIGRQQTWSTPVFLSFDGVSIEMAEESTRQWLAGIYGGAAVYQFAQSDDEGVVAGAYVEGRPWTKARARADYMYLENDVTLGTTESDLWTLALWQGGPEGMDFDGSFSILDSDPLDYRLTLNTHDADNDWSLRVSFYELVETKGLLPTEIDPFYGSLLDLFPFYQATVLASAYAWDSLSIQAGLDVRRVTDGGDIGQFNRDYERFHASGTLIDLGWEGVDLTLLGEIWDSDGNDISSWGLDLTSALQEDLQGSLGSYYSLFKYDYSTGGERDDVRTFYGRLDKDISEVLEFRVMYEYEINDFDDFQTLRLDLSWRL